MVNLLPEIDLSMVYRNYDSDFHSFYGKAFGEKNVNNNEKGLYWSLKIKPNTKHLFTPILTYSGLTLYNIKCTALLKALSI